MDSIPANEPPPAASLRSAELRGAERSRARARGRSLGVGLPLCLAAATCAGVALGYRVAGASGSELLAWLLLALSVASGLGVWLERRASRPLSTAATLLDALRHGDYAHRARVDALRGPSAALLAEVNELADHLERERLRRQETQALLDALIERIEVALLAFDAAELLVWWNPAAQGVLRSRLRRGASADSLGALGLLSGPSERSVTLEGPAGAEAFELRRGVFHRAGERYHFVLLTSAQRLRREEERAAWERLVRVLGHEVNSTLTPIHSLAGTCLSLLEGRSDAPPQLERALRAIEHRAHGLSQFIADYARLARLPEPRLSRLRLSTCLPRLIALDERCPVRLVAHGSVEVLADPVLLEQALTNLLRNAIDASVETGGSVSVDWQSSEAEVVLSIADEGAGIANPDNLFVPLFTTKKGGSGVGLVLARNIIEAHGGQLSLTNRSRVRGAVARVTLPRAPLGTAEPAS
jgi:nitrogen fixation/metabolism regulation signal transduction histidine kinase